jgi:asparagine synthase (glutamine-hydrolysing)
MCGIAGILTTRDELEMAPALTAMVRALRHRGPDDEGWEQVPLRNGYRLGLVSTRLAILDLSAAGHQPMTDPEAGSWIVYNGEVYNHAGVRRQLREESFRSCSDTETILKGWSRMGENLLPCLRGMFALAVYDGRRQQFWLVRDRLGIKPLYVSRATPETWVFASELRALLASGLVARRLNAAAIESYLALGAVAAPWTLLEGVESVLPGECWRFDLSAPNRPLVPERLRYWRPRFARQSASPPRREESLERLRPVLAEAVALRTVSDVPVGVFLSGGIDSSSIVAALAAQGRAVHTFSVGFLEFDFDESRHARLVAQQFGTDHTELVLSPRKVLAEFARAVEAYDQPSIDGLNTYFISQVTRDAGLKVALSGLGGDELFAGYPYFRLLARLERRIPRNLAKFAHSILRWLAPRSTRTTKLAAILDGRPSRLAKYVICRQVLPGWRRRALFPHTTSAAAGPLPGPLHAELEAEVAELDGVNAHSLFELSLYLANMLLRDTDQMSMAHALEVREPLLDHVLVQTVAELPGSLKLNGRHRPKDLLVDALPARLPKRVVRRRKMGFVFPWERWLRYELRQHISDLLTEPASVQATGLDPAPVRQLWSDFLASTPGVRSSDILCVVNLLHWTRQHRLAS